MPDFPHDAAADEAFPDADTDAWMTPAEWPDDEAGLALLGEQFDADPAGRAERQTRARLLKALHGGEADAPGAFARLLEQSRAHLTPPMLLEAAIEAVKLNDARALAALAPELPPDALDRLRCAALRLRAYRIAEHLSAELGTEPHIQDLIDTGDAEYLRRNIRLLANLLPDLRDDADGIYDRTHDILETHSPAILGVWLDYLREKRLPLRPVLERALTAGDTSAVDRILPLVPDLNARVESALNRPLLGELLAPFLWTPSGWRFMHEKIDGALPPNFPPPFPAADRAPALVAREHPDRAAWNLAMVRRLLAGGLSLAPRIDAVGTATNPIFAAIPAEALSYEIWETLLAAGADIHAEHGRAKSPLWHAYAHGNPIAIAVLHEAGANPEPVFQNPAWVPDLWILTLRRSILPDYAYDFPWTPPSALDPDAPGMTVCYEQFYAILDTLPWTPERLDDFLTRLSDITVEYCDPDGDPLDLPILPFLRRWPRLSTVQRDAILMAFS